KEQCYGFLWLMDLIGLSKKQSLESCREKRGKKKQLNSHTGLVLLSIRKSFVILALISTLIADPQDLLLTSSPSSPPSSISVFLKLPTFFESY
ncbi:unnamed protein product, partial [Citrullus colocynthis]